jgi:hypothetical protein
MLSILHVGVGVGAGFVSGRKETTEGKFEGSLEAYKSECCSKALD